MSPVDPARAHIVKAATTMAQCSLSDVVLLNCPSCFLSDVSCESINELSNVALKIVHSWSSIAKLPTKTVPHARSCDSEASVAESSTSQWNRECSVGR